MWRGGIGVCRRALVPALLALQAASCTLVQLREETRRLDASTVLAGRITAPPGWSGPVCVSAIEVGPSPPRVAHQVWLHESGGYELFVPRGRYEVVAFGDANANGRRDAGEPAGRYTAAVMADVDGVVANIDFPLDPGDASAPVPAWPADRPRYSTQAGALADLNDPAFSADNGVAGYWAPLSFFRRYGGNVVLLEPYDPARIPVLFVHGAAGSPQDFRALVDRLDRRRYQAWLYHYPSGSSLESMAYLLYWKLFNLQLRHRYQTLHVVAHSMGGLVVRRFMVDHGSQFPQLGAFVTLSTPWGGEPSAELGVQRSPAVVPSWRDMQPQGAFVQTLFDRKLPTTVSQYLLFSHRGAPGLTRPNNDGSVTLASQLRAEAQAEARLIMGFDEDHTSILGAPAVGTRVQGLLDGAGARGLGAGAAAAHGARVHLHFSVEGLSGPPLSQPMLVLAPLADGGASPSAPLFVPLGAEDSGRLIGPVPPGRYEASLVAEAYASTPPRSILALAGGQATELSVRLRPQGTLSGYVTAARAQGPAPAGSYRAPDRAVQITRIELRGDVVQRTLQPRVEGDDVLAHYLDGRDAAHGAQFVFTNLPEGRYRLCIEARSHLRHCSEHRVVPGLPRPFTPIELTPTP